MKRFLLLSALFAALASHAQIRDSLALKSSLPDFSYYSKNYNRVFDYYQYTFDAQKTSQKSVYVGSDNKFFFGQNHGFITDMPQPGYNGYRLGSSYSYDLGGLYHGLKNIFEMEKDYSVKRRD